jgi:hypothetical protein
VVNGTQRKGGVGNKKWGSPRFQSLRLPLQTGPAQTLLVNSKMRGKVVLHTMFEGQRDRSHAAGDTYSLRLAIDCCAFTNRVSTSFTRVESEAGSPGVGGTNPT